METYNVVCLSWMILHSFISLCLLTHLHIGFLLVHSKVFEFIHHCNGRHARFFYGPHVYTIESIFQYFIYINALFNQYRDILLLCGDINARIEWLHLRHNYQKDSYARSFGRYRFVNKG